MNKKQISMVASILITSLLTACASNSEYTMLNGEKVKKSLVSSGYYFDKASLSDAQIKDMVERVVTIEKPANLGTVEFTKNIEEIELTATLPTEVTEKDIEAKVESTRDEYREEKIVTSKRAAQIGDKVILNFTGKIDGVEFEGGSAIDEEIELGTGEMLEDFENGIIGHRPGENFNITVTFPADYQEPTLRNKKVVFSCLIKYMKEKVTPEFDDEFARKHSKTGATSSEAYRKEIAEEIKFRKEYAIREDLRTQAFNEILQVSKGTPSEEGLAWQWTKLITEQKRLANLRDVSYEEQMTNGYYAMSDILESYKFQSYQTIAEPMILDELSKKYNIIYTDEDKMQWFRDLCVYQEYGSDVTYKLYSNSMGEPYIYDNGRKAKVMDEVLKHMKIKYVNPENDGVVEGE